MQKLVLVVDDYEDARSFMRIILESYGHRVIEAQNGVEAVNNFNLFHPDLILMDISMPLMDGLTAARKIRNCSEGELVPIIAVSAFGENYLTRVMDAGCNYLIDKPIDFEMLEPIINKYLIHLH